MQRRHAAICAALVIVTAIPVLAQEPALELQLGGGFLLADRRPVVVAERGGRCRSLVEQFVGLLDAARDDHR